MSNITLKVSKDEAIALVTTWFETPTCDLPTAEFPALILENLGVEVEEQHVPIFIKTLLNRDIKTRPRKHKPVVEAKPPRVFKPKQLFLTFSTGEELIVPLKKEAVTEVESPGTEMNYEELDPITKRILADFEVTPEINGEDTESAVDYSNDLKDAELENLETGSTPEGFDSTSYPTPFI